MAKLLKILGRAVGGTIEWLMILIIVFAFAVRTSAVQTYLAQKAASYLSEELKAEVKIDKVAIVFFDRIALDGILIKDQAGDTLLSARRILVDLDEINLSKQSYTVREAILKNGYVHLQRSKNDKFNYAFIREYFVKDKKKKSKVKFKLRFAELDQIRFRYDDHRKEKRETGMDYFHLDAKNISGKISNLHLVEDTIYAKIEKLRAYEKCGFELKCLSTKAEVSPKGILLSDVEIISKDSWIRASKFDMLSKSYNGFKYFVDSVKFDGKIDESNVSLKDVAYFAYVLDGMDDHIRLKTQIKDKVTHLRLRGLDLRYGEKTFIKADINLADYRAFKDGFFEERLKEFYVDFAELKQFRLPNSAPNPHISLTPEIDRLKFLEGTDVSMVGYLKNFVFAANTFKTALGWAQLNQGINFEADKSGKFYEFKSSNTAGYDFTVHNFLLGSYLNNSDLGIVDGSFKLKGTVYSSSDIRFSQITGDINTFEYLNYAYQNINIKKGTFERDRFNGYITVQDEFLNLTYDGFMDFSGNNHMEFKVYISKADLQRLHFSETHAELLSEKIAVNISGKNLNTIQGSIEFDKFSYSVDDRNFDIDDFTLTITRGIKDKFEIKGSAGTALIEGNLALSEIENNFNYQFSQLFPAFYGESAKTYKNNVQDNFIYEAKFASPNNFLRLFYPELHIAPNTEISGNYNGADASFALKVKSDSVSYKGTRFEDLDLTQTLNGSSVTAQYDIAKFHYSDSLEFYDIHFKTDGGNDTLRHRLSWEDHKSPTSIFSWETQFFDIDHYSFVLNPSHFFIKEHQWDIQHASRVSIEADTIKVDNFELARKDQKIVINGQISNQDAHKLNFDVSNLELAEIAPFFTTTVDMTGTINLEGSISNPFNKLGYEGKGGLTHFVVNNQEIGDLSVKSEWDPLKQAITTSGDLFYAEEKTFDFSGDYYLFEKENNLDFELNFDYTNLQFTNAFMDPDVVSGIRGFLNGSLLLTGTPATPELDGEVDLNGGSAYIDILGVYFGLEGTVKADEYGFYMDGIPVFDQDGNAGILIGTIFHDNFKNFNFDLQFDLEPQLIASTNPLFGGDQFSKFLVMDLPYDYDALYYGKGYVTGNANIFGYTDNLEISVDFKTMPGTILNIPMYGVGEIDENTFITFKDQYEDTLENNFASMFDLSGVYLDLNFEATKDAAINIIFNEDIGDIISATGQGEIGITLDNQGDIRMEGTYEVLNGVYNFAMNPVTVSPIAVKQTFTIQPGGTISWSGNPYDAKLDLRTYYKLNANLSEISSDDQFGSGGGHQPILSYLILSGTMEEPQIQFDIEAPQADALGQSLLDRVTNDPDELSRQFFSLMLARKFKPLAGTRNTGGGAALDLLTNQINAMLSSISENYLLKVGIDNDIISGDNTYEFGISKGFLNDRLMLSGSFGVENYGQEEVDENGHVNSGQFIGDINLEYALNQSGTFRVNIFNESNDKTIIQDGAKGDFTQGAGLSYKEDFEGIEDFKLVQYVFDIFRKKDNRRYLNQGRRQKRPVPQTDTKQP